MNFARLRIVGFKSFVEPTDVPIEAGLTGIVGPNGCGKSNVVDALQWVMGESSHKAMRAAGMDDVIFAGSAARPRREFAEVTLAIDNGDRSAPAAFNDGDAIEVTRRIERESGSTYRVNGREVRARDVQLLFADAASGAHSPAMVGQGRVGALISAKPESRRAILEGAAGISGLFGRRHEAELRLQAAEQNLERTEDVLAEIDRQLESLRRQARQAVRYRSLSAEIRKSETAALVLRHRLAADALREAEAELAKAAALVAERAELQVRAARDQGVAASGIGALRDSAAAAAAAVQRLRLEGEHLAAEERRIAAETAALHKRREQAAADIERERRMVADNAAAQARLRDEAAALAAAAAGDDGRRVAIAAKLATAEASLADRERLAGEAAKALAELNAKAAQLRRTAEDARARRKRAADELATAERAKGDLETMMVIGRLEAGRAAVLAAEKAVAEAEAGAAAAEAASVAARGREAAARTASTEADAALAAAETEARTLRSLVVEDAAERPLIDRIAVRPGYEAALAAAIGAGLGLSDDPTAPAHWRLVPLSEGDPPLPEGAQSLVTFVDAPALLERRLSQTGVVAASEGAALQPLLRPGQVLVSREGDLWSWDGLVSTAGAPGSEAVRLAGRNRLTALNATIAEFGPAAVKAKGDLASARAAMQAASAAEAAGRDALRRRRTELDAVRNELAAAERADGQLATRTATLTEAAIRLAATHKEAEEALIAAEEALARLPAPTALEGPLGDLRARVAADRNAVIAARAERATADREAEQRAARLAAIAREEAAWRDREASSAAQNDALARRQAEIAAELDMLAAQPDALAAKRRALAGALEAAETERRKAADAASSAETALSNADKGAASALQALAEARELRGRSDERLTGARGRLAEFTARIADTLGMTPAEAAASAGLDGGSQQPALEQLEARVGRLKDERERLGGVNLQAESEAEQQAERRASIIADRDDLVAAIQKLRQGIAGLNREGRERLLAAFTTVDTRFRELFTHLFGGGAAELRLTEADDPLQAGLEIFARPPGKKLQTMTLMSGGEQALTALALIFAVFLTNPSPICVLDEVDAPLDDSNVERFCSLLEEMTRRTDTRFLVITHNPITMAKMNRLLGVTMAERGVSQLVAVDLETAERFREAS